MDSTTLKTLYTNTNSEKKSERELFILLQAAKTSGTPGQANAIKNDLVNKNIRLIYKIAKKYAGHNDLEDLIQSGTIGLIKAINNFDFDHETKLCTYAYSWIKKEILLQASANRSVNPKYSILVNKYNNAIANGMNNDEIQQLLKVSPAVLKRIAMMANHMDVLSLNTPISGDDDDCLTIEDTIDNDVSTEDLAIQNMDIKLLYATINKLDERQRIAISMRFGLSGGTQSTFGEIGKRLQMSQQGANLLFNKAIKDLKELYRNDGYEVSN